jgi:nitrite reductase (NADH) large subunit
LFTVLLKTLDLIKAYAANAKVGAVMGGGLLGLEAAKALIDLGIQKRMLSSLLPGLCPGK